jgi:hypothetical protein
MKKYILIILSLLSAVAIAQTDSPTLEQLILGEGITWPMFTVFMIFGALGLLTSVLFDIYSSGTTHKKFSLKYWWSCNKYRLSLSVLTVVIGVMFSEQLLSIKMSNWASFLAGFTSDKLIENLMQRKRRKGQNTDNNFSKN